MLIKGFSRSDTAVIKGFAILSIILHNLFRWINPYIGENEFFFSPQTINSFFNGFIDNPLDSINLLFSYFGHYGVQLFIFISGYGLAISMSKKNKKWISFIVDRLKKIYPLLIVGFLFYLFGKIIIYNEFVNLSELKRFALKFVFLHTIFPDEGLSIIGPWWFFGLIVQLYIIFPILFKLINKYNTKGLISIFVISYSILYFVQLCFYSLEDNFLMNCFGHIPEFSLGIWVALNKNRVINNIFVGVAIIIFILGNFYQIFFPLSFLCISFISIWFFNIILSKNRQNIVIKILAYYGSISMAIFAIHSIYRGPFIEMSKHFNSSAITLLLAIIYVIVITILSIPAKNIYSYIVSKLDNSQAMLISKIIE